MRVTLQDIAKEAGVSIGTVDRALHDRGRINKEVAANIKNLANDMGYHPNIAARAMSRKGRVVNIGYIIQMVESVFFNDVISGASDAKKEIENLGGSMSIKKIRGINNEEVFKTMGAMQKKGINGIAMVSMDNAEYAGIIDRFYDEYNIPVVTLNVDTPHSKRISFVGQDTYKSGKLSAGLMEEILGSGKTAIISGFRENSALRDRKEGYENEIRQNLHTIESVKCVYANNDNDTAEKLTRAIIKKYPDIRGLYVTSYGIIGVCRALEKLGISDSIKVIAFDDVPENIECLKNGTINFIIGQNGYEQGYRPAIILRDYLMNDIKPEKYNFTDISIKTRYDYD